MTNLVDELARLNDEQRRDVNRAAEAKRKRLIQDAAIAVRKAALVQFSARKAARIIDDVVRQRRRVWQDPALRLLVEQQLRAELGSLDDIGAFETLRKLFKA